MKLFQKKKKIIVEYDNYATPKLKARRVQLGLSYAEVARRLGFSTTYYWEIENTGKAPPDATVKKIEDALK